MKTGNLDTYPKSARILLHNRQYIPGGVVSVNRAIEPEITFVTGEGAYIQDADGNRFLDYHFGFAQHFLGHNDPYVTEAVLQAIKNRSSLFGSGTTLLEGDLAELFCRHVPAAESVQFLNTGSEATSLAIRLARAVTGRDHIIVVQGSYNGWHNDVCCNVMTPLDQLGPRVSPGEYNYAPLSAGIPRDHQKLIHIVNFNDLESVRHVCERYPIAALLTEPILQNVGIVKPQPGYMAGLRALADEYGFLLIFDEVKTGFRHAVGGYAEICNVMPDLATYGKAIANGYPIAAIAGKKEFMDWFVHPVLSKRVLLAGTYNAHPVPTAAAIATIQRLIMNGGEVYCHINRLGDKLEAGLTKIFSQMGIKATIARQGSAFCIYFMEHSPRDWHDLALHHNFETDLLFRRELVRRGVYFFPLAAKQCSISYAHTEADIDLTLQAVAEALGCVFSDSGASRIETVGATAEGSQ